MTASREDRQMRIRWWRQEKLADARVLVAGVGALGNEVAKNLALLGVGHLYLADFDTIELSNLSRSVLFRETDIQRPKAETAAARLLELNPHIRAIPLRADLNYDVGLGLFRRMDVVVGGVDSLLARLSVNRSCFRAGTPYLDGGMVELSGQVHCFIPPDPPCYECTLSDRDFRALRRRFSCPGLTREEMLAGRAPTTQTTTAVIGGLQAQEAVKIIHGRAPEPGQALYFEGDGNAWESVRIPENPDCYGHWTFEDERIREMAGATAEGTRVGDVLQWGADALGEGAVFETDRDLVTEFRCERCDSREPVMLPRGKVAESQALCAECGELRQFDVLSGEIAPGSEYADRTLSAIGVPPFHIVSTRRGTEYAHFELTGDSVSVLGT
jgi:molybdopterin/thiamine biosynthesis adenylyltransferase